MFRGWKILHDSRVLDGGAPTGEYGMQSEEAATKAVGGDELVGTILPLFAYWDNDIISVAAHFGVGYEYDEKTGEARVRDDIPPAPSPYHYWDEGAWQAPQSLEDATAAA
jgi:hypothetical protein